MFGYVKNKNISTFQNYFLKCNKKFTKIKQKTYSDFDM